MPFDPNTASWLPEETGKFDPSTAVLEPDDSLTPDQRDQVAGSLSELISMIPGAPPAVINKLLLTKGGRPGDIAANVIFPMAGGVAGAFAPVPGGTAMGGAGGAVLGDAVSQARQMLRGEREEFSGGSLVGSGITGAFVPGPVKAAGSLIGTVAKTAVVRGAQGVGLGASHEAITQLIDRGELDVGQIAEAGAWGAAFGTAFSALESAAPAIWKSISKLPPRRALETLAAQPDKTPEVTALQKQIEESLGVSPERKSAAESAQVLSEGLPPPSDGFTPQKWVGEDSAPAAQEPAPIAPTPEIAKTPPVKLTAVQNAIKDPDVTIQYNVWDREMIPPGRSRVAQVDLPSPNAPRGGFRDGNWSSTNLELLRELGVDAPDAPEWLPPGRYTLQQVKQAIAEGPPSAAAVGLGAASPAEFQPVREFTTSMRNAEFDREAVARGLPPPVEAARKTFGATWDEAMAKIDENQNVADDILSEVRDAPRPLKDFETAILAHRKIDLENQFNRATKNIEENIGTPDSLAADRATQQRVLDELLEVRKANRESGTELGRGLNIRKAQIAEDYSLATMMTERRVAKGGAKLTPEEEAQVRKQHDEINEAQRALDQHEAQLELDDAVSTPEEAQAQITKLESEVQAAEKAPKPAKKSPEEKQLEQFKKRTQKRIDDLRKRIESGDFSKPPRREVNLDEDANLLAAKLDKAKADFDAALERDRFEQLSGTQKLLQRAGDTYDAAKNIMTTGELSFIGRQGLIQGVSHPVRTAKAIPATFKALFADPVTARAIDLQTLNDPAAARAREAGVHLDEPDTRLAKKEEIVMSRWGDKTPIVRNFNQSGRVFLNKLRLDSFKALSDMKPDATKAELESFADYVNQSTGRGGLGQWGERNAVALSRTLFSPRFLTSRFQYLVGNSMWGGTPATRKILAREYARALIGLGTIYSLYEFGFSGDDKDGYQPVNFDPRSAMFGKMKIKNTTIDPLAGFSQAIVFGTRTGLTALDASGIETGPQYMTNKGKLVDLREPKFGADNWLDVAERFGRSKLHPIPGTVLNLMQGRDVVGRPATIRSEAVNFISPMTYPDIYDALKEQDVDDGTAIALLALLGAGINTYQEKEARLKQMGQPAPKKP